MPQACVNRAGETRRVAITHPRGAPEERATMGREAMN